MSDYGHLPGFTYCIRHRRLYCKQRAKTYKQLSIKLINIIH